MPPGAGISSSSPATNSGTSVRSLAVCPLPNVLPLVSPTPRRIALSTLSATFLPLNPILPNLAAIAPGAPTPVAMSPAVAVPIATSVGSSGSTIKKSVKSLRFKP